MMYRVFVNGENVLMLLDGRLQKVGFYTTRFVEAFDSAPAETVALERISSDLHRFAKNSDDDAPKMTVLETSPMNERDGSTVDPGFSFYADETASH